MILSIISDAKAVTNGRIYCSLFTEVSYSAMEKDHSIKSVESKGAAVSHSSGGKIP